MYLSRAMFMTKKIIVGGRVNVGICTRTCSLGRCSRKGDYCTPGLRLTHACQAVAEGEGEGKGGRNTVVGE